MNELELLLPQARPAVNWGKKSHVNAAACCSLVPVLLVLIHSGIVNAYIQTNDQGSPRGGGH